SSDLLNVNGYNREGSRPDHPTFFAPFEGPSRHNEQGTPCRRVQFHFSSSWLSETDRSSFSSHHPSGARRTRVRSPCLTTRRFVSYIRCSCASLRMATAMQGTSASTMLPLTHCAPVTMSTTTNS